MGYHPVVLCDKPKTKLGPLWDSIEIKILVPSSHLDGFLKTFFLFQWKLFLYLLKTSSPLWIAEDCPPLLTTALIGKFRSREVIYDSHEIFLETPNVNRNLIRKYFWKVWHNLGIYLIHRIITVSPNYVEYFKIKFPNKKYFLLPNVPLKSNIYRKIKPLDESINLIYQGYIRKDSNLEFLLMSLKKNKNYYLKIVGQGIETSHFKELTKKLNLEKQVKFIDTVPFEELNKLIANSDIGINILQPQCISFDLTWGNKMFDYLQAGIPTLLGTTTSISELLKEHPIGIQVDGNNPASITEGLKKLVLQYSQYSDYCFKQREYFVWENHEENLKHFIQKK